MGWAGAIRVGHLKRGCIFVQVRIGGELCIFFLQGAREVRAAADVAAALFYSEADHSVFFTRPYTPLDIALRAKVLEVPYYRGINVVLISI